MVEIILEYIQLLKKIYACMLQIIQIGKKYNYTILMRFREYFKGFESPYRVLS